MGHRLQFAESFDEASTIDRADLIEHDLTVLACKSTTYARWIGLSFRRHGRDDDSAEVAIHLIRRHDDARSDLLDLASDRRIEIDEVDVEPPDYHSHSAPSKAVSDAGSSGSLSSPRSAMRRNASFHP